MIPIFAICVRYVEGPAGVQSPGSLIYIPGRHSTAGLALGSLLELEAALTGMICEVKLNRKAVDSSNICRIKRFIEAPLQKCGFVILEYT